MPKKARKKSTRPAHHTGPSIPRARPSVNPLKRRIRDLDRLLSGPRGDALPADVKLGYERELAAARKDLDEAELKVARDRMVKKYHMVRFFERKKALRRLKKAKARVVQAQKDDRAEEETKKLQDEVHNCDVDLQYTLHFPLDMKYSSLYNTDEVHDEDMAAEPGSTLEISSTQTTKVARDHPMWKSVEQAMASGTLAQLREGKLIDEKTGAMEMVAAPKTKKRKAGRTQTDTEKKLRSRAQSGLEAGESDDDETGGAFFE